MALIVMAKKGYGEEAERRYPNLAGKVNLIYEGDSRFVICNCRIQISGLILNVCEGRPDRVQFGGHFIPAQFWGLLMKCKGRMTALLMIALLAGAAIGQQGSKHILGADELKKALPAEYFFRGQKAPVQVRNAVGFQMADGKMMLAALVDASGYSTAIQQKYQGLLITEVKLKIGESALLPGQYGFGFTSDGKFMVMDVGNNDVLSTSSQTDQGVQHAVPLKLVEDGSGYKLYAGKKSVGITAE